MKNEVRIKPLLKYEVTTFGEEVPDVFTADEYDNIDGRYVFRRTGNVIREYPHSVTKIVVTPTDEG